MYNNYIQDFLNDEVTLEELEDYVDYWHDNNTGKTLQEFLGLTDYEYEQWGQKSDLIISDIIYCRQNNIDLLNYNKMKQKK